MARIAGINLALEKRIEAALLAITGVGRSLAKKICDNAKINPDKKVKELTEKEEEALRTEVAKQPTEGDLRRIVNQNVKLLQDIGSYRGNRHKKRLPCRGQRTRSNARTKRGKKMTMGSGRAKVEKK
ncbi:30S ribosomal protein S13 [Candidatus Gracilibacteria bacterium]|nr:30S ribosomal protein S13 [Candidatus Gracilibacteria bacterium]MCF7897126.1 30S ribosomal protein S13 [Candidatus Gracilibacteria bacterium]